MCTHIGYYKFVPSPSLYGPNYIAGSQLIFSFYRNVEAVHYRLLKEGKMSLTFKSPSHLVMISAADPKYLEVLIKVLNDSFLIMSKKFEDFIKPEFLKKVKAPKSDVKSMSIELISQYPAPTGVGFPKTLINLSIQHLKYRHIDNRICALEFLQSLALSDNQLKKLPWGLWQMKSLVSLDVSNNKISDLPMDIPKNSNLCRNLQCLNLSNNELPDFPSFLKHCQSLNTLKIGGNPIGFVPNFFKACSPTLRVLDIQNCKLTNLPACLTHFSLNELSFDGNPFPPPVDNNSQFKTTIYKGKCGVSSRIGLDSLQACCVKSILRHKVVISDLIPEPLLNYINSAQFCDGCFKLVLENSIVYYYQAKIEKFARTYTRLHKNHPVIPGFVCSNKCFKRVAAGKQVIPASLFFKKSSLI